VSDQARIIQDRLRREQAAFEARLAEESPPDYGRDDEPQDEADPPAGLRGEA
jgi:hypothetical protein